MVAAVRKGCALLAGVLSWLLTTQATASALVHNCLNNLQLPPLTDAACQAASTSIYSIASHQSFMCITCFHWTSCRIVEAMSKLCIDMANDITIYSPTEASS